MRLFINTHITVILYLIRIPTRFLMIYLGSIQASIYDVAYFTFLSLILIGFVKNAPVSIFWPSYTDAYKGRWIDRLNLPLCRALLIHLGSAGLMAGFFYGLGYSVF